jgi:glycosyltransferase involved in cell wall biosynthesis
MRVAIVHDWLTGMRGGERVLEGMLDLFPDAEIFTLLHIPGSVSSRIEARPIHTSPLQRAPFVRRRYRRYLPLFPLAVEALEPRGFDLVLSSSHCVAKAVRARGAPHLCYCHTPMRYAWDQEHSYFPNRQGIRAHLRSLALTGLRAWDVSSSSRVNLFVANSRFVARRIQTYYSRPAEVVHPPVDVELFTPGRAARKEEYCLMVSALAPYKRIEHAMAACEKVGLELRVVGEGPERRRLAAMAGPNVRFLGKVDARQLRDLYRGARLFLQPGVEDFGIASVEALACGTPVVAVARGGVLDVIEDGRQGVLYPDWEGPAALAEAIDKARRIGFNASDLRDRAESFSVARFTDRIRVFLSNRLPS